MKTVKEILGENETCAARCGCLRERQTQESVPSTFREIRRGFACWLTFCKLRPIPSEVAEASPGIFSSWSANRDRSYFATDDSVDIFEIHCEDHFPEKHETSAREKRLSAHSGGSQGLFRDAERTIERRQLPKIHPRKRLRNGESFLEDESRASPTRFVFHVVEHLANNVHSDAARPDVFEISAADALRIARAPVVA